MVNRIEKKNYLVRRVNSFHLFQSDVTCMAVAVNSRAREDVSSNEGLNGGLLVIFEGFNYGSSFASLFGTNHPNLFDFQVSSFVVLCSACKKEELIRNCWHANKQSIKQTNIF